jgi:hypothetical protein
MKSEPSVSDPTCTDNEYITPSHRDVRGTDDAALCCKGARCASLFCDVFDFYTTPSFLLFLTNIEQWVLICIILGYRRITIYKFIYLRMTVTNKQKH